MEKRHHLRSKVARAVSVAVVLSLMVLGACTKTGGTTTGTTTTTTTTSATTPAAPQPTLTIVSPANGASLTAGDLTVTIQVTDFTIVDKQGQANVAGQGHVHYFLDIDAPTTPGQPAIPGGGIWAHVAATTYTFTNVAPGPHTISVELVNNDHTPLEPPAVARISVTVTPMSTTPAVSILSPSATVNGIGDVKVTVQVSNLTLSNKLGQANVAGEGHLIYFLDVDAPTTAGQPAFTAPGTYAATADTSFTWHNVGPGLHNLSVELVNNDNTPLAPPVVATLVVAVTPAAGQPGAIIASPTVGTTLPPGPITVTALVVNFNIASVLGGANVVGQGHIDFYMDVSIPTAPGKPAVAASSNFAAVTATSYTWPDVPVGTHTFGIQVVNNDDTPLTPPVVALVQVTVAVAPTTEGTLQISAIDAALPAVDHALVVLNNLEVHEPGGAWLPMTAGPVTVDLMSIQGVEQMLASKAMKPGKFTQVRFDIQSVTVQVGAQSYQAIMPAGKTSLVGEFSVAISETTKVIIYFNAVKSVVNTGVGQYVFNPVVSIYIPKTSALQIITGGLPNGSVGIPYSESLGWLGGTPQLWSVVGGSLPSGMVLDPNTGIVHGMPTTPEFAAFTVRVVDKSVPVQTATKEFTIRIAAQNLVVITTTVLPAAEKGEPYSFTLGAISGTTPFTWSWAATTGSLPPGLTLDPKTGVISGTPTVAGDYGLVITVKDSSYVSYTDTQILILHILE